MKTKSTEHSTFDLYDTDIICTSISTTDTINQIHPKRVLQLGDIKHVDLGETVEKVTHVEVVEQHIVPTVTEIHQQEVINIVESPIVRTIRERPIIRYVDHLTEQDEEFVKQQRWQEKFTQDIRIKRATLASAHPFSKDEFKNDIKQGVRFRSARPLSRSSFAGELQAKKKQLRKSRYFSQDSFVPDFMKQKRMLHAVDTQYSNELNSLRTWKGDDTLTLTSEYMKSAFEGISNKLHTFFGDK
jgi:hypothetical protein